MLLEATRPARVRAGCRAGARSRFGLRVVVMMGDMIMIRMLLSVLMDIGVAIPLEISYGYGFGYRYWSM